MANPPRDRSRTRLRIAAAAASAAAASAFGCSLINSYDDLKPENDGKYAASPATPSELLDGALVDGAYVPPVTMDVGPVPDAATPPSGLIVTTAQVVEDGSLVNVLTVLDPRDGHEIAPRERMVVAGLRYDGFTDLWYIFESSSSDIAPGPADTVTLHVRSFDAAKGTWTEHVKTPNLAPPLGYETIAPLRGRLVYLAYPSGAAADGGLPEFVTINTEMPSKPTIVNRVPLDRSAGVPIITWSPSDTLGGKVHVVRTGATDAGSVIEYLPFLVPSNGDPPKISGAVQPTDSSGGYLFAGRAPAVGNYFKAFEDILVLPPSPPGPATLTVVNNSSYSLASTAPIAFTDFTIKRVAVAECEGVALVIGTNADTYVHAIPIGNADGGVAAAANHSGQALYYEPTTHTVIAPFNQGNARGSFTAFKLGGDATAAKLTPRTKDWSPPTDLRPLLLATKVPLPITCP